MALPTPNPGVLIRPCDLSDQPAIRRCIVELQAFERTLDPSLPPGEEMADAYWAQVQRRCDASGGRVFVAEIRGALAGFVAVVAAEPFTEPDDPPGTYGLVTDLVVLAAHRGAGVGRQLLHQAEAFARAAGATELRVGVLSANVTARHLYASEGFAPHLEILRKRLTPAR